jgi:NAD(P)-dependent dehydrogenase (short-subunit alcohol dehydrogenase family)
MDKVILITGGAGGIGVETGSRLASAGVRVIIADVNATLAQAKSAEMRLFRNSSA